jgi:hypothetical protein
MRLSQLDALADLAVALGIDSHPEPKWEIEPR